MPQAQIGPCNESIAKKQFKVLAWLWHMQDLYASEPHRQICENGGSTLKVSLGEAFPPARELYKPCLQLARSFYTSMEEIWPIHESRGSSEVHAQDLFGTQDRWDHDADTVTKNNCRKLLTLGAELQCLDSRTRL